jgi:hypothetical protein
LRKNWRKVGRHLDHPRVVATLVRDMNRYRWGRWRKHFTAEMLPAEVDYADWRCCTGRRGRRPTFWDYACSGACHWLVNHNIELARLLEPERPWRVVKSDLHSTVWDGKNLLFEFNGPAMNTPPDECFAMAKLHPSSREMPIGKQAPCGLPEYWKRKQKKEPSVMDQKSKKEAPKAPIGIVRSPHTDEQLRAAGINVLPPSGKGFVLPSGRPEPKQPTREALLSLGFKERKNSGKAHTFLASGSSQRRTED